MFGLALYALDRRRALRGLRMILVVLLIGVAATALVAALANGVITWLRTFGLLSRVHVIGPLSIGCVSAGILIGTTRAGRKTLLEVYSPAKFGMALGGLAMLSLPFTGWGSNAPPHPAGAIQGTATGDTRPNILLVTIDTLSAEHMSLYGAARPTTPSLEAFARDATVFDHAYSNGNFTTPGIASIVTGTRPWTHRALQLQAWPIADARSNSLPALLHQAGYQTAYASGGTWAGAERNGLGAYFDFRMPDADAMITPCRDRLSGVLPYDCLATELAPFLFAGMLFEKVWQFAFDTRPNWQYDPRKAIRPALEWLASADKRTPIFLWIHLMPPHSPYAPPEPWLGKYDSSREARTMADSDSEDAYLFSMISKDRARVLSARYDEAVNYVDYFVGEYLKRSLALLGDNTVVILTADHGESFSHGYGKHTGPGLYESIIHIPLIVKLPYQTHGVRTSHVAEQVDIAPTIAELAGFSTGPGWEGRSLVQICRSTQADALAPVTPVFAMNFEQNPRRSSLVTGSVAVIEGHWKFVEYMGTLHYRLMPPLNDQLYDLSADPNEQANQISDFPDEAQRLRGVIAAELLRHGAAVP
jgi:arylsulfatase A-like enzyme